MADSNKFTIEEFNEMKEFLSGITTHIPEANAGYVWNNYKKITNSTEPTPCLCGSSAAHWRKAIDAMREYVKQNEADNG